MKISLFVVSLLSITAFIVSAKSVRAQQQEPFAQFELNVPREREIFHLDNFAIYLIKYPTFQGYMKYYVGGKDSKQKVAAYANRAKRYLVEKRHIRGDRVLVTYAGEFRPQSMIVLVLKEQKAVGAHR